MQSACFSCLSALYPPRDVSIVVPRTKDVLAQARVVPCGCTECALLTLKTHFDCDAPAWGRGRCRRLVQRVPDAHRHGGGLPNREDVSLRGQKREKQQSCPCFPGGMEVTDRITPSRARSSLKSKNFVRCAVYVRHVESASSWMAAAIQLVLQHLADSTCLMYGSYVIEFVGFVDARAREGVFISVTSMPSDVEFTNYMAFLLQRTQLGA